MCSVQPLLCRGFWRNYHRSPLTWNIQQCLLDVDLDVLRCNRRNLPDPDSAPIYACALNEFCDDSGICRSMRQSPLFGAACGRGDACGPGLSCLAGICAICTADTPQYRLRNGQTHVRRYQSEYEAPPHYMSTPTPDRSVFVLPAFRARAMYAACGHTCHPVCVVLHRACICVTGSVRKKFSLLAASTNNMN